MFGWVFSCISAFIYNYTKKSRLKQEVTLFFFFSCRWKWNFYAATFWSTTSVLTICPSSDQLCLEAWTQEEHWNIDRWVLERSCGVHRRTQLCWGCWTQSFTSWRSWRSGWASGPRASGSFQHSYTAWPPWWRNWTGPSTGLEWTTSVSWTRWGPLQLDHHSYVCVCVFSFRLWDSYVALFLDFFWKTTQKLKTFRKIKNIYVEDVVWWRGKN